MRVCAAIAWRYLLTGKFKGAVGTISAVSVTAMAIATAAIVCVLSVFNGFEDVINERAGVLQADLTVFPASGKRIEGADSLAEAIAGISGVMAATPTVSEKALLITGGQEMPVSMKGVNPGEYARVTGVKGLIHPEEGRYLSGEKEAVASVGVAARLGAFPGERLLLFVPKRKGRYNPANPAATFMLDTLVTSGIYRADQSEYDFDGLIVTLGVARRLLQYGDAASAIEIRLKPDISAQNAASALQEELGKGYKVKQRAELQEGNYRMVRIEKWITFLLLGFILTIAGFNLISSLSMVVLQKSADNRTLVALGMSKRRIGAIFAWQSLYTAMSGCVVGLLLGAGMVYAQQKWGIVKLGGVPGSTIVDAYPVRLEWPDLAATLVPAVVIGLVTAWITSLFAQSRLETGRE